MLAATPPSQPPVKTDLDSVTIAQRTLTAVGVLALVGTILALMLVNRLGETYQEGLEVAQDGAEVAAISTASVGALATDLTALTLTAADALEQAGEIVVLASDATADIGTALGTNLADGIEGIVGISDGLAGFIEAVERFIPGDSDSLAEDLTAIAEGLEPLPEQLRTLGDQLDTTATALADATESIALGVTQLETLSESIADAQTALDEVERLADDVAARAEAALDRSESNLTLMRLLVIVIGVGVVAVCFAAHRALGALSRRSAEAAAI